MRRFLFLLEQMLRNQAGVHVRLPSHLAQPFNARPLYADGVDITNFIPGGSTEQFRIVTLGFPSPAQVNVPAGWRAEITRIGLTVMTLSALALGEPTETIFWQLLINDAPFSPFLNLRPLGTCTIALFAQPPNSPAGPFTGFMTQMHLSAIDVSVHLQEGDGAALNANLRSTSAQLFVAGFLQGWMYPLRVESSGIRGTVTD